MFLHAPIHASDHQIGSQAYVVQEFEVRNPNLHKLMNSPLLIQSLNPNPLL
jgi:hypothetical protein